MDEYNACFDWASSFYDYSRTIPNDLMQQIIDSLQERIVLDSSSKILEVGIGTGRIAIPLAENLDLKLTGVDISEKMLHECQEKMFPTNNIQLVLADGLSLPFNLKSHFDLIYTCHVLHLLPNAYQFIEEIIHLLDKNGFYINLEAYVDYYQTRPFEIYYKKLSKAGFRHGYRGDLVRHGLIIYLSRRGWYHQEHIIRSEKLISNNNIVRFLRDRVFSHQRTISLDLHTQALNHLYKELEEKSIDLTKEVYVPAIARLNLFKREKQ